MQALRVDRDRMFMASRLINSPFIEIDLPSTEKLPLAILVPKKSITYLFLQDKACVYTRAVVYWTCLRHKYINHYIVDLPLSTLRRSSLQPAGSYSALFF